MYNLKLHGIENTNPYEELIRLFLLPSQYRVFTDEDEAVPKDAREFTDEGDKNALKRQIYQTLAQMTGKRPKWGILTGIRPVKLAGELHETFGSWKKTRQCLEETYLLDKEKVDLICRIYQYQQKRLGRPDPKSAGVYISIPFCPTRCLYCSFPSNQEGMGEIERYLDALFREVRFVGRQMEKSGIQADSLYIGGGTPTTLTVEQLEQLFLHVEESFDLSGLREFTVEAGRPDTITSEKLEVMERFGVGRISINPQTMNDQTLERIGRSHTAQQTRQAFQMAHEAGIRVINSDLIAGLPGEKTEDFHQSLEQVLELGANNVTVHTLAVKRASRLKELDEEIYHRQAEQTEAMLEHAAGVLGKSGYHPYYLYRQKHTAGNTENIGYCKNYALSLYNVRIMEEAQTIIALGAGGITKVYDPEENRLERVPNVSNYEIYIERIEEMLERKARNLFRR